MSLAEYRKKRDFRVTAEPRGAASKKRRAALSYVIHKHDATRLHYDLRLELDGVYKSWAVPKGPSFDPANKRLAVHVEDHPYEYGKFEGVIPAGEYGAGPVIVWDRGVWTPEGDPHEGLRRGKLEFTMEGEKLHGAWILVRSGGRRASGQIGDERNWLFFKRTDDFARQAAHGAEIVDTAPASVDSGRTIEEVLAGKAARKNKAKKKSTRKSNGVSAAVAKKKTTKPTVRRAAAKGAKSAARAPAAQKKKETTAAIALEPQLATLADAAPEGDHWLHELKFDGYRIVADVAGGAARLVSRNGKDWTAKFPEVAQAAAKLPVRRAVLDGEVVALDERGVSSFQALQQALSERHTGQLAYYVFDLLTLDGDDLRGLPLEARKERLAKLIPATDRGRLRFSDHVRGNGQQFHRQACAQGLEGIVSKRADRPYRAGRGADWLKVKCSARQEFVIGGYTAPEGSRVGFGALLVGYYENGKLHYAGRVGTGFNDKLLADMRQKLARLEQAGSPFDDFPPRRSAARGISWVEPKLVGEVEFTEWTADGRLRHPAFLGLRLDKAAKTVRRERPKIRPRAAEAPGGKGSLKQRAAAEPSRNGAGAAAKGAPKGADAPVEFSGVTLTHPGRVLFPQERLTKLDLARYYDAVSRWMLPHISGRPIGILRCPEGAGKPCFVQKHPGNSVPPSVDRVVIKEKTRTEPHMVVDDVAGLVGLVQVGALEIHVWGCRRDRIEHPDQLVFDLDPDPKVAWPRMITAAEHLRAMLKELGLETFLKTTGGKGLHVVAPIQRRTEWDEAKRFCRLVADALVALRPNDYTSNLSKAARGGKIFVDYLRNGRGAMAVAPYSTRAKAKATVAMPIAWQELKKGVKPDSFNVESALARLRRQKNDPWAAWFDTRQSITERMVAALEKVVSGARG